MSTVSSIGNGAAMSVEARPSERTRALDEFRAQLKEAREEVQDKRRVHQELVDKKNPPASAQEIRQAHREVRVAKQKRDEIRERYVRLGGVVGREDKQEAGRNDGKAQSTDEQQRRICTLLSKQQAANEEQYRRLCDKEGLQPEKPSVTPPQSSVVPPKDSYDFVGTVADAFMEGVREGVGVGSKPALSLPAQVEIPEVTDEDADPSNCIPPEHFEPAALPKGEVDGVIDAIGEYLEGTPMVVQLPKKQQLQVIDSIMNGKGGLAEWIDGWDLGTPATPAPPLPTVIADMAGKVDRGVDTVVRGIHDVVEDAEHKLTTGIGNLMNSVDQWLFGSGSETSSVVEPKPQPPVVAPSGGVGTEIANTFVTTQEDQLPTGYKVPSGYQPQMENDDIKIVTTKTWQYKTTETEYPFGLLKGGPSWEMGKAEVVAEEVHAEGQRTTQSGNGAADEELDLSTLEPTIVSDKIENPAAAEKVLGVMQA